jgi:tetratricopeptide (TPR) repeat protein
MKKTFIICIFLFIQIICIHAQRISVDVPSHVQTGENFRVAYTVNTQDVENFRSGSFPTGLELIAGPYTSQQKSFQMINGHTSSSSSVTYTYIVYAEKGGTYIIPAAHAIVEGKTIKSIAAKVIVSGSKQNSQGAPKMHDEGQNPSRTKSAGQKITAADLFIKVSSNKKRVHEQEPILLTYKVYTLVDLTQLEGKMPDLTGFHTQEVQLPQQKSFHVEKVNGRNYRCVTWSQYVMYPQMTGSLKIPSITFKGIVVEQNRSVDPFEAFFNGGSGYIEVKHDVVAPGMTIQIDPLPKRPVGFSGGVGKFNISAQVNHNNVKAGNPLNIRVVVGGIGNLKLIKQPQIILPKDFDKYDPKVTDKTRLTSNGVEGNMVYDFLVVPRNQGLYTIPAIQFTYYDTSINSYKTLKTTSFKIAVGKGDGSTAVDDYSKDNPNDIRGIKIGNENMHSVNVFYFGSTGYWMGIIVPILIFIIMLYLFRKRAIENADVIMMRGKKANKVAAKRLRVAQSLMFKGAKDEFYDEVLRALWGYVGDKLIMSVEHLSRENISEMLKSHNVDEVTIQKFINAIDECEYERYAPGDISGNMSKTFNSAMTAIEVIENVIKRSKKNHKNTIVVMIIMLISVIPLSSFALTKENADIEYQQGHYQKAIIDYKALLKNGVNASLYYNLGNAYYRTDSITQSIIALEHAKMLSPGDDDIRFNLEFVRSKTIDKITPENEMFFVTWYHSLINFTSVDNWAHTSIFVLIVALILLMVYFIASRIFLRRISFYGAIICFVLFFGFNFFAYKQKSMLDNRTEAVIISPSVNIKKTPSATSSDEFVLHEGTKVNIIDSGVRGWKAIKIADGREGWILSNQIEEI